MCVPTTLHGTPIMLRAEQEGITPRQLIDRVWQEHKTDFDGFYVDFDNYYTTDSPENQEFCEDIYRQLEAKNLIAKRSVEQFYDPVKRNVSAGPVYQGRMPELPCEGPIWRLLRSVWRHLFANRSNQPLLRCFRGKTGTSGFRTSLLQAFGPALQGISKRMGF